MFENTKVIKDFVAADIMDAKLRKEYGYGNTTHDVKESRKMIYKRLQQLSKNLVKSAAIELEVRGLENLPKEGPALYMATHKSVFDIIILLSIIEDPSIFVGKKEVAKMPFVNKWFDALGCIYLDREDKRQALKSIIQGIEELKSGQSVVIFPEGTRSMSNEILPFKEGCFKLATKTQVPIIPIALSNTYKIFEEKRRIQKTRVVVNIGEAIDTKVITREEQVQLPKVVEQKVRGLMENIV